LLLRRAGALNFRDVMLAYGKLSKDLMSQGNGGSQIGLEFSGVVGHGGHYSPACRMLLAREDS
jgi:hypothetical protein